MKVTKEKFVNSAMWKILEQFSSKGVSMLVSIILGRLLLPEDYGIIALTAIFTNLSDILIDGGFATVLIRKEKVDGVDYACAFTISSLIATFLYAVLFFIAPLVSEYYAEPRLTAVLRVVGLTFFIQAFASTRNATVNRNMQFKLLFNCNIVASIISGFAGIVAAYFGLGVWALVIQRLVQQTVLTVLLLTKVEWKFRWQLEWSRIREMLKFSLGVVGSSLINYFGGSLYNAIIGKRYSVTDLGYCDKGAQLPTQLSLYTFGAMSGVLLPTISSCQNDLPRVKSIIRKVTSMTAFLILPMMVGLALVSKEVITLLFSEKWIPSVPFMQWSCLYYIATPFMLINVQVFFALGHSEKRVFTEIVRLVMIIVGFVVFGILLKCDIYVLNAVNAVIAVLAALVSFVVAKPMINYSFRELISDTIRPLVGSVMMGVVVFLVQHLLVPVVGGNIILLIIKGTVGVTMYYVLARILKMDGLDEALGLVKKIARKKKAENE